MIISRDALLRAPWGHLGWQLMFARTVCLWKCLQHICSLLLTVMLPTSMGASVERSKQTPPLLAPQELSACWTDSHWLTVNLLCADA